jgi:DNA-binding MarR family transcriptional regulator
MEELSDWLGMERTTLVRNLRPLERDGLVELSGTGRGGRVTLAITASGRKALARMMPAWRAAQDEVVGTLGKRRWSAIINDLEQAALKLSKQ